MIIYTFLDTVFFDRQGGVINIQSFFEELLKYDIIMNEIIDSYLKAKDYIDDMEKDIIGEAKTRWHKSGTIRTILDICTDRFLNNRYNEHTKEIVLCICNFFLVII